MGHEYTIHFIIIFITRTERIKKAIYEQVVIEIVTFCTQILVIYSTQVLFNKSRTLMAMASL